MEKDITKRIKTYADACTVLGVEQIKEEALKKLGFTDEEIVGRKLKEIATALNEGWTPNWGDKSEYKYYPYFRINTGGATCGLAYVLSLDVFSASYSHFGSRLAFKTPELAEYAASQFLSLYQTYLVG